MLFYQERKSVFGVLTKVYWCLEALLVPQHYSFMNSIQRFAFQKLLQYNIYIQSLHILASALISEKAGKIIYLSVIFGFMGTFVILEFLLIHNFNAIKNINLFIALAGSALTALAYVLVRWLSSRRISFVIMFYFPLFTVPVSFMFTINNWITPDLKLWIHLILIGICAQIAQYFLTHGYKLLPAGKASLTGYVQVPLSVLAGYLFFNDKITYSYFIGSCMIFTGVILQWLRQPTIQAMIRKKDITFWSKNNFIL